jgi:acyl carrier protein
MMQQNSQQRVVKIVNKITGNRAANIHLESDLKAELALDSVQMVELFAALEKEFGVELPLQLMNAKTGKEFFETLGKSLHSIPAR